MKRGVVERLGKAALRQVCRRKGHRWEKTSDVSDDRMFVDGYELVGRCLRCGTIAWSV